MNDLVELNINSSTNRFEDWLGRHTLRTLPFIIKLTKEKNLSVIGGRTLRIVNMGFRKHEIKAMITKLPPTEPNTEVGLFIFPAIEFEIFESAENRVIVNFRQCNDRLLPYLFNLLGEIAKVWPETKEDVDKFLKQFISEEEQPLDTPQEDTDLEKGDDEEMDESSNEEPWNQIPDKNWDRYALELWWLGFTNGEIAEKVFAAPRRVTNRISELRGSFGEKIVPYDYRRKKILREKSRDIV